MQSLQSLNQPHQEMQAVLHRQTDLHLARLLGDGFMNIPDGIDEELPFN